MKQLIFIMITGVLLAGCSDKKTEEKAVLDSVLKVHDKVMSADEKLMANKMRLDTLLKQDDLVGKDTAAVLNKKLTDAENAMENWMHKFNIEQTGKSHDETTAYFTDQKKQITAIDSQINVAITESDKYLAKVKRK